MKAGYFYLLLMQLYTLTALGQEIKRSNFWIIGSQPVVKYNFNNSLQIDTVINTSLSSSPYCILSASSSVVSDTNGQLLFFSNGFILYDSKGYAMDSGIYVNCPQGKVLANYYGMSPFDQTSIILPKKGNTYYVFSAGMSDSVANNYINHIKTEFDVLNYSVVDMDSNGGLGKVVQKNVVLADKQHYHFTQLSAVKHSNGKDWWLVKADCNNNRYQEFLVKEDTILGPYYQNASTIGDFCTVSSQMYFSQDGSKMACSMYGNIDTSGSGLFYYYNRVELYDVDRCSGEITYKRHYIVPYDTSTYINRDYKQGICFSPDGKLLYMSTNYSIFQIDVEDTNTNNALYIHGPDTSNLTYFPLYGTMAIAPDGKIYIGNSNGIRKYMSYIDSPNVKGLGCHFVPQGVWQPYTNLMCPPNMPNYGLGIDSSHLGCWPLSQSESVERQSEEWVVYPNPASTQLYFRGAERKKKMLYNAYGVLITETCKEEMDIKNLSRGLYFVHCNNLSKKIVVE